MESLSGSTARAFIIKSSMSAWSLYALTLKLCKVSLKLRAAAYLRVGGKAAKGEQLRFEILGEACCSGAARSTDGASDGSVDLVG